MWIPIALSLIAQVTETAPVKDVAYHLDLLKVNAIEWGAHLLIALLIFLSGKRLVAAVGAGVSLQLVKMALVLTSSTFLNPEPWEETGPTVSTSFMFDPAPPPPSGWLRVGGTPSWRSVLTMSLPREVTGTPQPCRAASAGTTRQV